MNTKTTVSLALAAALTLLASCSPSSKNSAQTFANAPSISANIIGGTEATLDYQKENGIVSLAMITQDKRGNQGMALCSASLIAPNMVLTAAHCAIPMDGGRMVALIVIFNNKIDEALQKLNSHDTSEVRFVDDGKVNQNYLKSKGEMDDTALVHFKGDMPEGFQFAQMPTAEDVKNLTLGSTLTLAGYGVSIDPHDAQQGRNVQQGQDDGAGVLRHIEDRVITALPTDGKTITLDQSEGHGACHGDSGGPAYIVDPATHKNVLIGIGSRTTNEQGICTPGIVYSNVFGYTQWIKDALAEVSAREAAKPTQNGSVATGN